MRPIFLKALLALWGIAPNVEAEQAFFYQPLLILEYREHCRRESRYHALGKTDDVRLLHITFTLRSASTLIRVISARDMHRKERTIYEQSQKDT